MKSIDERHPEACYRRGFQQGAHLALEAIALSDGAFIDPGRLQELRMWVGKTLLNWRYHSDQRPPFVNGEYNPKRCAPEPPLPRPARTPKGELERGG